MKEVKGEVQLEFVVDVDEQQVAPIHETQTGVPSVEPQLCDDIIYHLVPLRILQNRCGTLRGP